MQAFYQKKVLINEQQIGDTNTVQRIAPQGSPRTPTAR